MKALTLSLLWLAVASEPDYTKKCDVALLNSFRLQGVPFAAKGEPMLICNRIEFNCCTLLDELQIVKYWHEFSMPKIRDFVAVFVRLYESIFEFQKMISMIDYKNVVVHLTKRSRLHYTERVCSLIEGVDTNTSFIPNSEFINIHQEIERASKALSEEMKEKNQQMIDEASESIGLTGNHKRKLALKNAIFLKRGLARTTANAIARLHRLLRVQHNELLSNAEKVINEYTQSEQKNETEKLLEFLRSSQSNLHEIRNDGSENAITFITQGRNLFKSRPQRISKQAKRITRFLKLLDAHFKLAKIKVETLASKQHKIYSEEEGLNKQLYQISKLRALTEVEHTSEDEEIKREGPDIPLAMESILECKDHNRNFLKHFLLLNTVKYRFCFKTFQNLQVINTIDISSVLASVRTTLTELFSMKKSLYCAICNQTQQKFFDADKGMVYFSQDFCFEKIRMHRDYIKFNNMLFIEYADEIMQYIKCLTSGPYELDVPFKTRLEKHKMKMMFFKRCFSHLYSKDFMRYCSFICSKFNFNGAHPYIEGSVKDIYLLYMEIVEFLRENNIPIDKRAIINSDYLSKISSEFYDNYRKKGDEAEEEDRELGLNLLNRDEKNLTEEARKLAQEKEKDEQMKKNAVVKVQGKRFTVSTPIYTRVKKVVLVKNLQPVFLDMGEGLNPYAIDNGSVFDVNLDYFIDLHFNKIRGDSTIHRDVLKHYFSTNTTDIHNFNNDVNIAIAPAHNMTDDIELEDEGNYDPDALAKPVKAPPIQHKERTDQDFHEVF